jgi:hypothetical protein
LNIDDDSDDRDDNHDDYDVMMIMMMMMTAILAMMMLIMIIFMILKMYMLVEINHYRQQDGSNYSFYPISIYLSIYHIISIHLYIYLSIVFT